MKKETLFLVVILLCGGVGAAESDARPNARRNPFGAGGYQIGPEDLIEIFVWKEPELSTEVMVRPDGKISVPLIGDIEASGKTGDQLQTEIQEALSRFISRPVVNVLIKEVNSPKIAVLGEVRRPDWYGIRQKITVLDAIAMAGGITEYGGSEVLVIRNNGTQVRRFKLDLKAILEKYDGSLFYLQPADTVYVK